MIYLNPLGKGIKDLCIRQFQVISVFDLKLKWRKISDWLRGLGVTADVWSFDELREYIESEVSHNG